MQNQFVRINGKIAGVLSYPDNADKEHTLIPAVLLLHGFASDKNEINNFYQDLAEELSILGIASLRIDFYGWGESDGETKDSTLANMVENAIDSIQYLSKIDFINENSIGINGFSLGAAIAMAVAGKVQCKSLSLLSPVSNPLKDLTTFLGEETIAELSATKTYITIELPWRTIEISHDFYNSLLSTDPLLLLKNYRKDLLCVAGEKDFSAKSVIEIIENSCSNNKHEEIIKNADHIFNMPDGKNHLNEIREKVGKWFQQTLV